MLESLWKQIKLQKNSYLLNLLLIGGAFLLGNIIHECIMKIERADSVFCLGTMLSITFVVAMTLFYGIQETYMSANFAIGMGQTRKRFYPVYLLATLIQYTLAALVLLVLGQLEQLKLAVFYPSYEVEQIVDVPGSFALIILSIVLVCVAVSSLFGVLMLRFGKVVFWIIWAIWMGTCILGPRVAENLAHTGSAAARNLVETISRAPSVFFFLLALVVSFIMYVCGWISLRTQEVRL